MKSRDFTEKDGLRVVRNKLAAAEARVIRKFRQDLTPREKELLVSKVPELQARERGENTAKDINDPLLRDIYSQVCLRARAPACVCVCVCLCE